MCVAFLQVYRAQFGKTIAEEKVQEPYVKKMIGMLALLLAASVGLFSFLRKYGEYSGLLLNNYSMRALSSAEAQRFFFGWGGSAE